MCFARLLEALLCTQARCLCVCACVCVCAICTSVSVSYYVLGFRVEQVQPNSL